MGKISLLKFIFITSLVLVVIDIKFELGPIPDLILEGLFAIGAFLILKLQSTKAVKIYAYLHIITINLSLLTNSITAPSNITDALNSKINLLTAIISTVTFSLLIIGLNNYKILGLNKETHFNQFKLLKVFIISTLLFQTIIRLC